MAERRWGGETQFLRLHIRNRCGYPDNIAFPEKLHN